MEEVSGRTDYGVPDNINSSMTWCEIVSRNRLRHSFLLFGTMNIYCNCKFVNRDTTIPAKVFRSLEYCVARKTIDFLSFFSLSFSLSHDNIYNNNLKKIIECLNERKIINITRWPERVIFAHVSNKMIQIYVCSTNSNKYRKNLYIVYFYYHSRFVFKLETRD